MTEILFSKKELYLMEKQLDTHRDEILKGIAQHVRIAQDNKDFKEKITDKIFGDVVSYFDMLNGICFKLEKMRLGNLSPIIVKEIDTP